MHSAADIVAFARNHLLHAIEAIALVLALRHGHNLAKVTRDLKRVLRSLPTQPLYEFPKYVPKIADLVRHAKRHILICCDQPAYGSFSDQDAFLEYRQALITHVNAGKPVRLRCLDQEGRRANTERQFSKLLKFKKEWNQF